MVTWEIESIMQLEFYIVHRVFKTLQKSLKQPPDKKGMKNEAFFQRERERAICMVDLLSLTCFEIAVK